MIHIISDLHTHTVHSHGTGGVEDNVRAAIAKGLRAIAISDHGVGHLFYNIKDVDAYLRDIADIKRKYDGQIDVYSSVELNLMSLDGKLDIPTDYADAFDLKMVGYHKMVGYKDMRSRLHFLLPKSKSAKAVELNTQAYSAAIRNNKVDMISHLGYGLPVDKAAIARVAAECGVALEINAKHPEFSVEELVQCAKTGVKFVIGSDAHSPDRVGDFVAAITKAKQAGITSAQIINAE